MALTVRGRASYFGGPNDSMNTGTALGLPDTAVGVAVRPGGSFMSGRKTLGGYWRVKVQGKTFVIRQIDIGPHERTGRKVDFTAAALKKYGLKDPTDQTVTAVYLGKKKPSGKAVVKKPKPKVVKTAPVAAPSNQAALQAALQTSHPFALSNLMALAPSRR